MLCGVALGSNVGDRLGHLNAARKALEKLRAGENAPLFSPIYETEPVDCTPGTAPYLNAVMEIEYDGEPLALFHALQEIERAQGRPTAHARNAPRTLDLDLLYAGDCILQTPELTLPHPRLTQRRFVLQPLADLRPDLILPGTQQTVFQLLAGLPPFPGVRMFLQQ